MSQSGKMTKDEIVAALGRQSPLLKTQANALAQAVYDFPNDIMRERLVSALGAYTHNLMATSYELGYDAKVDEEVQRHMEDYRMDLKTQEAVKEL